MKKIFILTIYLLFVSQVFGFEIIPYKSFEPSLERNEYDAIIYENKLIYKTTGENEYVFIDLETLEESKLENKREILYFLDFLYYKNVEENNYYGFFTNQKIEKNFYTGQVKNRNNRIYNNTSTFPLYGNNEIYSEADEYTAEFEYGFPIVYHNGAEYELPYPLNKVIGHMLETYMFQSYDLFKLVTFVDKLYDEDKNFKPFICISDVIYDGSVTEETTVYEEPSFGSRQICKIDRDTHFTVSKSSNYEKEADYQDFWYYIYDQDFSGWVRGKTLLIEGDSWKDRLELRGEYFTEDDL